MQQRSESKFCSISLLPRYEAEGFTVIVHPSSSVLPPFMGRYRPDAIALSPGKKIAIEVKRNSDTAKNITGLSEIFAQNPDWELRIYYLSSSTGQKRISEPTHQSIEQAIKEISELSDSGHTTAAIMMAWATLEAIGRKLLPEEFSRAQPADRLVEVLATKGLITPSEADLFRRAGKLRNAIAHGDLDAPVSGAQVEELPVPLRALADLLPRAEISNG